MPWKQGGPVVQAGSLYGSGVDIETGVVEVTKVVNVNDVAKDYLLRP